MPKTEKIEVDGSPHQLCCPKCKGTEFNNYLQNVPLAPFLPESGFANFVPCLWQVCVKCGWDTGKTPIGNNKRNFKKLIEWSRAKQLEGLRRMSYGYKQTQEEIDNCFKKVDEC